MDNNSRVQEIIDDVKSVGRCFRFMWNHRNTYIIYCSIAAVLSLIISFSIPKTYSVSVVLAPEPTSAGSASGFSSIAAVAGINIGSVNEDAYTLDLYPTIVASKDFCLGLRNIVVKPDDTEPEMSYFDYLLNHQKKPWWKYPKKWISSLKKPKDKENSVGVKILQDDKYLSDKEYAFHGMFREKVNCTNESLNGVLTITVYDQSPEIAVLMADSVVYRLNQFILDYRTSKARAEYEYTLKLSEDSYKRYIKAQERYVTYARSHSSVSSPANMAELEFLKNEVGIAYSSYSNLSTQLQLAQAKILESTPVYTVVESSYVPLSADSPNKILFLILFVFMACVVATSKLLYSRFYYNK